MRVVARGVRRPIWVNRQGDSRLADVVILLIYTLFAFICAFPFYYIIIHAVSGNELVAKGQILLWPVGMHFSNFVSVLRLEGLPMAAFISVSRTAGGTALTLLCTMFLGYSMTRPEYWKRKFWYRFVVVTMYFQAGVIPWFITMKTLGLYNRFLVYVLPGAVSAFYMVLYKTYVESIPASLEESAQLDGAGYLTRFFRIIFPLSTPMLATICVFTAVGQWNAFTDTLFLISSSKLYTLQFVLYQYMTEAESLARMIRNTGTATGAALASGQTLTSTAVRMTITVVVVFPVMLVYPFFQRYFIRGIMIGAVKG